MSDSIWDILKIEPIKDKKQIKRAYAAALKNCHPEEDPEAFKRLHDAYEQALKYAETSEPQVFQANTVIHLKNGAATEEIIEMIREVVFRELERSGPVNVEIKITDNGTERGNAEDKENKEKNQGIGSNETENNEAQSSGSAAGENAEEAKKDSHADEHEKISRFFADREQEKGANMRILNYKLKWFRDHWHDGQAQNEMADYLSGSRFAGIREDPDVLRFIYCGLSDRRGVFGKAIRKAVWDQYGFSPDEVLSPDDMHYNIYRILADEQKKRMQEEQNMQFQAMMEECDRISARKRKRAIKIILLAVAVICIPVLIRTAKKMFLRYQYARQVIEEHEALNDELLEKLGDKYPGISFETLKILPGGQRERYHVAAVAKDGSFDRYKVLVDVSLGAGESISFQDDLGEQIIEKAQKDHGITLALGSNVEYVSEETADTLLVVYYTDEESDMEQIYRFLTGDDFRERFQWIDEIVFCYENAAYGRYFFEGGEGGLPAVLRYAADSIPEKDLFLNELYTQGLLYYFHYVPWQMKQEFLEEGAALYNTAAEQFDAEQSRILADVALSDMEEAEQAEKLISFADSYGVKLLLFQNDDKLYITDGDLYRLLVAAGADVERNRMYTGFELHSPDGKVYLFGAGAASHVTGCRVALAYLNGLM